MEGNLAAGATAPKLNVNAKVEVAAYPAATNTVDASSATPDPNSSNNNATDELKVAPAPAWSISKTAQDTLEVGKTGTYIIKIKNIGLTEEPGTTTVTDKLPSSLKYISATVDKAKCSEHDGAVKCDLAGPIAVAKPALLCSESRCRRVPTPLSRTLR